MGQGFSSFDVPHEVHRKKHGSCTPQEDEKSDQDEKDVFHKESIAQRLLHFLSFDFAIGLSVQNRTCCITSAAFVRGNGIPLSRAWVCPDAPDVSVSVHSCTDFGHASRIGLQLRLAVGHRVSQGFFDMRMRS